MNISDHKPVADTPHNGLLGSASHDAYVEATCYAGELLQHYDGVAPTYYQIKTALYSGRIPGWKMPNGRWALPRASRDAIAAAFGMTPKVVASAEHANA